MAVLGFLITSFWPFDPDLAFICLIQSVQNIHQGGFTGSVLAQKCVDASLFHAELHTVQSAEGPKVLAHPCISTAYTFSEAADTLFILSDSLLIQPTRSIDLVQAIYIKYIVD